MSVRIDTAEHPFGSPDFATEVKRQVRLGLSVACESLARDLPDLTRFSFTVSPDQPTGGIDSIYRIDVLSNDSREVQAEDFIYEAICDSLTSFHRAVLAVDCGLGFTDPRKKNVTIAVSDYLGVKGEDVYARFGKVEWTTADLAGILADHGIEVTHERVSAFRDAISEDALANQMAEVGYQHLVSALDRFEGRIAAA